MEVEGATKGLGAVTRLQVPVEKPDRLAVERAKGRRIVRLPLPSHLGHRAACGVPR